MKSIKWWNSLTPFQRDTIVNEWRENTDDFRKDWSIQMLSLSTSTIQNIYNYEKEKSNQEPAIFEAL